MRTFLAHRWARFLAALTVVGSMIALSASGSATTNPPASISFGQYDQQIAGFGVAGACGLTNAHPPEQQGALAIMNLPQSVRKQILDWLFYTPGGGTGFSLLRLSIGDGSPFCGPTIEPAQNQFDWSALNQTQDSGQAWLAKQAQGYGVSNFLYTPWSPPGWMKTGTDPITNGGGMLNPTYYPDFAKYLATFAAGYASHFGITPSEISLQNEPDIAGTNSSSDQWPQSGQANDFDSFIKNSLISAFASQHVTSKVLMPEQSTWSDAMAASTLADPTAAAQVGVVAAHGYFTPSPSPFSDAQQAGKPVWQSEVSGFNGPNDNSIADGIKWAENIDLWMAQADASAWLWWWPVVTNLQPGSQPASESNLIQVDTNGGYTIAPRFFTIAQYSQFVRPGWSRITATHQPYCVSGSSGDQGCVNVTAFENPTTKQFAIIAINDTGSAVTQPFSLAGGTSASVTPYVTSGSQAMLQQSPISVSNGTFTATLPTQSVTTFVGQAA